MKKLIALSLITVTLACSCGGKKEEPVQDSTANKNPLQALADASKNMSNTQDAASKKMAERKAKGDTLAMPYAELIKYLPTSLDGYKVEEEPTGTSVNMTGMSISNSEVIFKKGDDMVKITLVDYNAAYSMYQGVTAMWAMGVSIDSPDEMARGVKMDNDVAGWEDYKKKTKECTLTLGIGYRFWLEIDADNQENSDWVKSVAKSMDLAKLASL